MLVVEFLQNVTHSFNVHSLKGDVVELEDALGKELVELGLAVQSDKEPQAAAPAASTNVEAPIVPVTEETAPAGPTAEELAAQAKAQEEAEAKAAAEAEEAAAEAEAKAQAEAAAAQAEADAKAKDEADAAAAAAADTSANAQ